MEGMGKKVLIVAVILVVGFYVYNVSLTKKVNPWA